MSFNNQPITRHTMLKRTHEIKCAKCDVWEYAENIGMWNDDGTLQELGLCGACEEEDEGEWECERCGEGGKANDGAIKCRCGEEGVWSDDEAVCEEECVAWDDNGRCKRCGTKGGRAMMTAVVTETWTTAEIEARGGIQSVVTAFMNVKFK